MSEYKVDLDWASDSEDFAYDNYPRTHQWKFGGGIEVNASAAPEYLGKAEFVNPEEAFIASLASCHLLTFLAIASFKKFVVKSYHDTAMGFVGKNDKNKVAMLKVILRPKVEFGGSAKPSAEELNKMHEKAHAECFISNSVLSEVVVEPSTI